MRRRDKAGRKKAKTQRHKTLKRRNAPNSVAPDEVTDVAQLTRERDEAREQQTATAEILRVIRASPTDVQPVFDMIAESASRLCEAQFCFVYRFDGQLLHFVAHHSVSPKVVEINRRAYPQPPSRKSVAARAILEQSVVQILMSTRIPTTPSASWRLCADIGVALAFRYCAMVFLSGPSPSPVQRRGYSRSDRSNS